MFAALTKTKPAPKAPKLPPVVRQPANDNIVIVGAAVNYVAKVRAFAGADYIPPDAKAWWLP